MRKKVICLENMPFEAPVRVGSHHYARLFSERFDVLWISLPWHLGQLLRRADNPRYKQYNAGRPKSCAPHLRALTPFTLLPYRKGWPFCLDAIVENYHGLTVPRVDRLLGRYGFDDVELLWFSEPRHISILKCVRARRVAYRCVDNLEHFADVPAGLRRHEIDLIRRADAVFYTSRQLLDKNRSVAANGSYLPNGVDFEFFAAGGGLEPPQQVSAFLADDRSRNVIYMGTIAEWFDFESVAELARTFGGHRFVLVGPRRVSLPRDLLSLPNVLATGPLPYTTLPQLLRRCAVGLVPFRIDGITQFVNPIKLFEYCAAGLQVVASNTDATRELNCPAYLYEAGRITEAFSRAANEWSDRAIDRNRSYARQNSWARRFECILDRLDIRT